MSRKRILERKRPGRMVSLVLSIPSDWRDFLDIVTIRKSTRRQVVSRSAVLRELLGYGLEVYARELDFDWPLTKETLRRARSLKKPHVDRMSAVAHDLTLLFSSREGDGAYVPLSLADLRREFNRRDKKLVDAALAKLIKHHLVLARRERTGGRDRAVYVWNDPAKSTGSRREAVTRGDIDPLARRGFDLLHTSHEQRLRDGELS